MKTINIYKFVIELIVVYKCIVFVYCADKNEEGATGGVKPVTLNIKMTSTIDINFCKEGEDLKIFSPKPGREICKITKRGSEIWKTKPDDHAAKVVLKGSKKNKKYLAILLQSGNFLLFHKTGKGDPWVNITDTRLETAKLKMLNRYDDYINLNQCIIDISGFSIVYEFKSGISCHKIKVGDELIYDYEFMPDFGLLKKIYLDLLTNDITVVSHIDQLMKINMKEARSLPTPVPVHHTDLPSEVKLIGYEPVDPFDPDNPDNFSEIFHTKYSVKRVGPDYEYDLRNSKCVTIKCGDKTIWNKAHDSDMYPLSMKILKVEKTIIIRFSEHFVNLKLVDGDWKSEIFPYERKETSDQIVGAVGGSPAPTVVLTQEQLNAFSNYARIDLDIHNTRDNDQYTSKKRRNVVTFSAKEGHLFGSVRRKNELIWTSNGEFCNEVFADNVISLTFRYVSIKNVDGTFKHFTRAGNKWSEGGNGILFDMCVDYHTFLYECEHDGSARIFTPRLDLEFVRATYKDMKIWEGVNNENSPKIILKRRDKGEKYVAIMLNTGKYLLFHKSGKDQPWNEITNLRYDLRDLKLLKYDNTEIGRSEYEINLSNFSYSYIFKENVEITNIKYNNKAVWSYGSGRGVEYPRRLNLELIKNQLSLTFDLGIETKFYLT